MNTLKLLLIGITAGSIPQLHAISVREIQGLPPNADSSAEVRVLSVSNNGYSAGYSRAVSGGPNLPWQGHPNGTVKFLSDGVEGMAQGISADGTTVVGISVGQAFRWTSSGGFEYLGFLQPEEGSYHSDAHAASADGSVIVGGSARPKGGYEAFRWTQDGGMVGLGDFPGGLNYSIAYDVSADGSVIVGRGSGSSSSGYWTIEGFIWKESTGLVSLGLWDFGLGNRNTVATAVSADGSTVAGVAGWESNVKEAFIWREDIGRVGLGDLTGGRFDSKADDISGDGRIVVGQGITYDERGEAFVWDPEHGMQSLRDILARAGIDFSMWDNTELVSISPNGRYAVGIGGFNAGPFRSILIDFAETASDATAKLISDIVALNLQSGIENSLDAKLQTALSALDDLNEQNDQAACNSLEAFISAVQAQRDKKIPSEAADVLIARVDEIKALMPCF